MKDIKNLFAGILIGISNAIPGVSGGTMAVILNIYDKILEAVSIRHWREHKRFLAVFAVGAAIGIIGLSKIIIPLRENYPVVLGFCFIGLIVGSLPLIYKHAMGCDGKPKRYNVVLCIFAFSVLVAMSMMNKGDIANKTLEEFGGMSVTFAFALVVTSAVAAIAMIIPGISGSLVMLLMGTYTVVIEGIADMNFVVLVPVGCGVLIGLAVGIKGIKRALELFPQAMYFTILGLVAGSVFPVYPGWQANGEGVCAIICAVVLGIIAYVSSRGEMKDN